MDEQKYQEGKIRELLGEMSAAFYKLTFIWEHSNDQDEDAQMEETIRKESFIENAKKVYKLIVSYLESKSQKELLDDFKNEFRPIINDRNKLLDSEYNDDADVAVSLTLKKFWEHLIPFEFSQYNYTDRLLQQAGVTYLERILKNTQVILNKICSTPKSEPKVYNDVKFVIKAVFPSAGDAPSGFFKSFKNYKPDILIPEIQTAVEYKYANNDKKLISQIEQVLVDTRGYTDNPNYELFYAVFYVTADFWGIPRFEKTWKEMKFPKNWKGIYIVGT